MVVPKKLDKVQYFISIIDFWCSCDNDIIVVVGR